MQVTVKRVPDGAVSNWMNDTLAEGDEVEATYPAGVFCLGPGAGDLVLFAAGSGITPVYSLVKAALADSSRRIHLFYANRDRENTIFALELEALAEKHPDRVELVHHFDAEKGFVDPDTVAPFAWKGDDPDFYLCGPGPFMDIVESALVDQGIAPDRIHIERFTPPDPVVPPAPGTGQAPRSPSSSVAGRRPPPTTRGPRSCRPRGSWGWAHRPRARPGAAPPAWPCSSTGR
jgi:ferredoxin-NADP reductase